jgi:hypothetical protein
MRRKLMAVALASAVVTRRGGKIFARRCGAVSAFLI